MTAAAPLAILPELGPPGWIALGVIGIGAAGYAGYKWYQSRADAATDADEKAKGLSEGAAEETCQRCKEKPCRQFACGVPGSKYRGGAHWCMKEAGKASHHMPPDAVSPVDRELGPAIQMEKADHYQTPSYGRSLRAPYMSAQGERAGGGNFMGAFAVDAAAVESKFPGKYTGAIGQARAYAECLKKTGNAK